MIRATLFNGMNEKYSYSLFRQLKYPLFAFAKWKTRSPWSLDFIAIAMSRQYPTRVNPVLCDFTVTQAV